MRRLIPISLLSLLLLAACGGPPLIGANKVEDSHPIAVVPQPDGGWKAIPSPCGDFEDNLAYNPNNVLAPNFGCASQNNLARAVVDPRDLVESRPATPRRVVPPSGRGAAAAGQ